MKTIHEIGLHDQRDKYIIIEELGKILKKYEHLQLQPLVNELKEFIREENK